MCRSEIPHLCGYHLGPRDGVITGRREFEDVASSQACTIAVAGATVTPAAPQARDHRERPAGRVLLAVGAVGLLVVIAGVYLLLRPDGDGGAVDPAWLGSPPSGVVRYCSGEDVSRSQLQSVKDFNNSEYGKNATAKLDDTASPNARTQRAEYLRLLRQKSQDKCDIVYLDVPYMAEFAHENLLYEMTPYLKQSGIEEEFDARMLTTARYQDKLWGVPKQLDVGVLFYRTDKGIRRPRSWGQVYDQAQQKKAGELPRLRFQGFDEGLTVVFLELAYSAGAQPIISADGKQAEIDQAPAIEAVEFMRRAIDVSDQAYKGSLYVFERGRALLMRNWPFAAARIRRDARIEEEKARAPSAPQWRRRDAAAMRKTAHAFTVVPLPPWNRGDPSVAILGGHDLVIPRNAANPRAALRLIDFLTSFEQVRRDARHFSQFPVLESLASDPDIVNREKTLTAIRDTDRVEPRPVIANYADVSKIISDGLKRALGNHRPVSDALRDLDQAVQDALNEQ